MELNIQCPSIDSKAWGKLTEQEKKYCEGTRSRSSPLTKNKRANRQFWDVTVLILIIVTGLLYYMTTKIRVEKGYYLADEWVYLDNLMYIIFFGLFTGYIISLLISKTSAEHEN